MSTYLRSSRLAATLIAVAFASGCASRPDPADVALSVASTKPGTEYHLTGTVNLDGKSTTVDQQTPYRFTGKGVETNAKLISTDADCQLLATFTSGVDRDLSNQATGPAGCEVILTMQVKERTSATSIQVKALPVPAAPVAAPVEAPKAAPIQAPASAPAATDKP